MHDLSCVGRCSLTVALPVLSAAGVNAAVVPTALLSTHTGEFTGYTHLDLSGELMPIARHLATLGLHYDAFYSGYLASPEQTRLVESMRALLCDEQTHVFVDPAFADHGRLYALMDERMPAEMKRLCRHATTITPNLTEAALMLGVPYRDHGYGMDELLSIVRGLAALDVNNVVVTDISFRPQELGTAVYLRDTDMLRMFMKPRFPGVFHGTGDVFASFLLAALLCGQTIFDAAELASDCTHESIRITVAEGQPYRYGVQFERVLPLMMKRLGLFEA